MTTLGCRFRAHYVCLLTMEATLYKIRGYPLNLQRASITMGSLSPVGENATLQSRVFLGLTISHPLTNLTFVALEKRLHINQSQNGERFISCSLTRESNSVQRGYEPNYVCLPLSDLRIEL